MDIFFQITFFVLGTIIGSFLNVVIFRLNTQRTFGGRSACLFCRHKLSWYELIPVVSFFFLLGRCKKCRSKISFQYPVVEILTGLIFLFLFLKFQGIFYLYPLSFAFLYAFYATLFSVLMIIVVYDIKHKIIPDSLSFLFSLLAFVGMFVFSKGIISIHFPSWDNFVAGLVISLPFALLWYFSKGKAMGLGDAKISVGLGFMLGLSGVITSTVLAFWIGAVFGVLMLWLRKVKNLKSEIPFAPFLVLGAVLVFFFHFNFFFFNF